MKPLMLLRAGFAIALGLGAIAVATPAQAQDRFDNTAIQFETDTVVEFEFLESDGVYQSTFGVVNLNTGDRTPLIQETRPSDRTLSSIVNPSNGTGTPGNSVLQPLAEFEFEANTPYAFYLESRYNGQAAGVIYSVDTQNPNNSRLLRFDGDPSRLGNGGVLLRWDDTGSLLVPPTQQDRDYDDFTVRAGGHLACPE